MTDKAPQSSNHQVHLSAIEAIAERLVRDRHEKGYAATPEADTLRLVIAELKDLRQEMGAPMLLSASARCPLCGQEGPHPHTPLEQAIYRNGLKAGSLHAETPLERAFAEEPQRTIVNDALLKIGAGDETAEKPLATEEFCDAWIIHFDDHDVPIETYVGHGAGDAARRAFEQRLTNWECQLFRMVDNGRRPRPAVETRGNQ